MLRLRRWSARPELLTVTVSLLTFVVINFLGFWDVEDLFTSGSSLGARFGFSTGIDRTNDLIYSLWGVPLLDFGIIGGYRLPFQGTINTGPLWILRNLLPAEVILVSTHLISMMIAAVSFGRLWKHTLGTATQRFRLSSLLCAVCWASLSLPTFEYLIQQDWYAVSLVNQGFIAIVASLLTLLVDVTKRDISTNDLKRSIQLALGGGYFLILGHTGTLVVYSPTMFLLAIAVAYTVWRHRSKITFDWRVWKLELLFVVVLISRGLVLVTELVAELSFRTSLGEKTWWAEPTRSFGDFKHFLGQLAGTELKPLIMTFSGDFLAKYNISALSRLPHSAVLVVVMILIRLIRQRRMNKESLAVLTISLWILNFLWMVRVIPDFVRVPIDYVYRDILLLLAMVSIPLACHQSRTDRPNSKNGLILLPLIFVVSLTSFAVAISNPVNQLRLIGGQSPFTLASLSRQPDSWITALSSPDSGSPDILAVIDPVLLSRWQDESITDKRRRDWEGLRGFYQLRQAGLVSLEGTPKIRDATAFTGRFDSLVQWLDAPSPEFCSPLLMGFLGVDRVVTSTETRLTCLDRLRSTVRGVAPSWNISPARQLAKSNFWISEFEFTSAIVSNSKQTQHRDPVRCGLLTDPDCFMKLGFVESKQWTIYTSACELPCVSQLKRTSTDDHFEHSIVLPLNSGNSLNATDSMGHRVSTTEVNGLIAIPTENLKSASIQISVTPDFRMWLQVFAAYFQYAILLLLLLARIRSALGGTALLSAVSRWRIRDSAYERS